MAFQTVLVLCLILPYSQNNSLVLFSVLLVVYQENEKNNLEQNVFIDSVFIMSFFLINDALLILSTL